MNKARDIIALSKHICRTYLRYKTHDKQKLYAKALAMYLCYYDSYLKLDIDLNLFNFLVKIVRNNFLIDKAVIKKISLVTILEEFKK